MTPYHQRVYKQGVDWIAGISRHNDIDGECCPDFSCCVSDVFVTDRAKRVARFNEWARENEYKQFTDS